jgi:hypothetical protein
MSRMIAVFAVALGLVSCEAINTLVDGWRNARAVETDLAASVGMKPHVGFKWTNGRLESVTVMFPHVDEARTLPELVRIVRRAVGAGFKQTPEDIVLGFSLGKGAGATAQLHEMY